jgi:formylglycine-generating enzyme required for sulfatase activity
MITIPEGEVLMGTSEDQVDDLLAKEEWAEEWYANDLFQAEQPQHSVYVPEFEIARFPVSNKDYYLFTWETGYRVPRTWLGFHYSEEEGDHPVAGISRVDALAYCEWLSKHISKKIPGAVYRLPSEREWERAARGDDERIYPWGNAFDPWRCNTVESGRRGTTEGTIFSPSGDSPFGVNDMVGNVWEWTSTEMRPYPYDPKDGREDPASRAECVIRGGSWYYSRKLARCSARESVLPTFQSPALGFRLARTP